MKHHTRKASAILLFSAAVVGGASFATHALSQNDPTSLDLSSNAASSQSPAAVVGLDVSAKATSVRALKFAQDWNSHAVAQAGPNCFGTTLAALGAIERPRFASELEIRHVIKSCAPVKSARAGDVGMLYFADEEVHSFIFTDKKTAFYKNGLELSGKYVTRALSAMGKDFNVGMSEEACADRVAQMTTESGVPCPTRLSIYRCAFEAHDLAGGQGDFLATDIRTEDERVLLGQFKAFDRALTSVVLESPQPTAEQMKRFRLMTNAIAKHIAAIQSSQQAIAHERELSQVLASRLDSYFGFFLYYADPSLWPENEIAPVKRDLEAARKSLLFFAE